jgi:hypothetical protein
MLLSTLFKALPFSKVNAEIPESLNTDILTVAEDFIPPISDELRQAISEFHSILGDSVRRRVIDIPSHKYVRIWL